MGGPFGTVLDTKKLHLVWFGEVLYFGLLRAQHLLFSIQWDSCSEVESHFMLLIKLVSNNCSNLIKFSPQVDFGLSQAHKKAHALI